MGGDCLTNDACSCVCHDDFVTSGYDCLVADAHYLGHTCSFVFLSIGIIFVVAGIVWLIYEIKSFIPSEAEEVVDLDNKQ